MTPPADVTVVVAVWDDYCEFLRNCVESALRDRATRQLVVVDNASARPLPSLPVGTDVVRSSQRLSVGAARNLGLESVRTPYVAFLDADDLLLPDALSFLRERLESRPGAVSAVGRYVSWNPITDERMLIRRAPTPIAVAASRWRSLFALANLRYNTFPVVGCVHRTAAVREAGGFGDGDVGEDWILGAMLAFRGRILFHERATFLRRVHEGSLWYRSHPADKLVRRSDLLRARAAADPAVPRWAKLTLPLLARLHHRDVRRTTTGGALTVRHRLLAPEADR